MSVMEENDDSDPPNGQVYHVLSITDMFAGTAVTLFNKVTILFN